MLPSIGADWCAQVAGAQLTDAAPWGGGTLGDALLAPTVLYVRPVLQLIQQLPVKVRLLVTLTEASSAST
jgi:phosphoribosylaminoimidazole (AIR) synthetase